MRIISEHQKGRQNLVTESIPSPEKGSLMWHFSNVI
jgi:hypothetical protein